MPPYRTIPSNEEPSWITSSRLALFLSLKTKLMLYYQYRPRFHTETKRATNLRG
jgi:hypothetical protein